MILFIIFIIWFSVYRSGSDTARMDSDAAPRHRLPQSNEYPGTPFTMAMHIPLKAKGMGQFSRIACGIRFQRLSFYVGVTKRLPATVSNRSRKKCRRDAPQ
jgi:hypothetical protein